MRRLGLTISMGAGGVTLKAPEGVTDLRPLTGPQLRTLGTLISDTMGLRNRTPKSHQKKDR